MHPAASYPIAWDIRRLPQLRPWLSAVDEARRPAVRAVLDRFEQRVAPELATVRAQVVHNDLAPTNVLVDDTLAVTGITDFGDMTHTALICDLGVAAADVLCGRDDALDVAHEVLVRLCRHHTAGGAGGGTPGRPDGRRGTPPAS